MFEEFENKIFNTPIGEFIGVNSNSPHTHLIHKAIYNWSSGWYIGLKKGNICEVVFNTSETFNHNKKGHKFYFTPGRWIPVNILDRTNPTLEEIKKQIKF
jgi:hypothetical protein